MGGTAQGRRGETLSSERGVRPVAAELPLDAKRQDGVERVRRFAATLREVLPICEDSLTRIMEAVQRVLFRVFKFSAFVYAIYQLFTHL